MTRVRRVLGIFAGGFGVVAAPLVSTNAMAAPPQPMSFYGGSLGQSAIKCGGSYVQPSFNIIARHAGTTYSVSQLGGSLGANGTISTDYGVVTVTGLPTTAAEFRIDTSDVAYVLLSEVCNGASGALVYPADDGIATVGSRVTMYSPYSSSSTSGSNFVAAVGSAVTATISTASGAVVAGPQAIAANGAWSPPGLSANTVYIVTSTGGDVTVGSTSINSYALLAAADSRAASCQNDTASRFFGATLTYNSGGGNATGFAVFNDTAGSATVTVTQLTGGSNSYTLSNAAGNASTYFTQLVANGTYRFDANKPVTLWAGSPEGTNTIDNLGDDIAIAVGRWDGASTYRVRSRAQSAARVFARNGSVVTVNGANTTVGASENFAITGGQDVVVTSSTPFLLQSQDAQSQTDWAKWLRPLPKVDSDGDTVPDTTEAPGGECQSIAPDSDGDTVPDFLDADSDNDCIADSNASETGAARTNPTLPAGAHCSGTTPICTVFSGAYVGSCVACDGGFGSGTGHACPTSGAPMCLSDGSCVACNGDFGSGTSVACGTATKPICLASGMCSGCDGDFGASTTAACPAATAPECQANGACAPCNGNFGSGTSNACKSASASICLASGACGPCDGDFGSSTNAACPSATAPFCSGGQCLACNGAYGSGAADACKVATTPVCSSIGACLGCNGGFGSGQSLSCQLSDTPVCSAAGSCTTCNGDNASFATQPCPTTANPYCFTSGADAGAAGTCGKCGANADCVGHPNGPVCNPATGGCGQSCFTDADCNQATQWCAGSTCTAKTPNAQGIPNVAPVNGQCTAANGARVCQSGVCSSADNTCGLKPGDFCMSDAATGPDGGSPGDVLCQSGICAPSGTCGTCHVDSDCGTATSGKVCDDTTLTCKSGCRGTGGNKCPGLQVCSSTTNGIGTCGSGQPDAGVVDAGGKSDGGAVDAGGGVDASIDATLPEDAGADADDDAAAGEGGVPLEDTGGVFEGGGISCSTSHAATSTGAARLLGLLALLGVVRRRRRR